MSSSLGQLKVGSFAYSLRLRRPDIGADAIKIDPVGFSLVFQGFKEKTSADAAFGDRHFPTKNKKFAERRLNELEKF